MDEKSGYWRVSGFTVQFERALTANKSDNWSFL